MSKRKQHPEPLQPLEPVRPGIGQLLIYAVGQVGWSLASFSVGNLLVYFYLPPEQGTPMFPAHFYQGAVLAVFTVVGLLSAFGRIFDSILDPLVANWSDRTLSAMGRRRWFLLWGALPFALFGYLVFVPPHAVEHGENMAWVMLMMLLYYFFFTFYVIPYTALIAELGHTERDRLRISTLLSFAWSLGFIGGNAVYALQGYFEQQGYVAAEAFQRSVFYIQLAAFILMLVPALFLRETVHARGQSSSMGLFKALRLVFAHPHFVCFLKSDLLYWASLTFIQLGLGYYTTLLLGLDKSYAFLFSLSGFLASIPFYAPVQRLAARFGKKAIMLWGFWVFILVFLLVALVRYLPFPGQVMMFIIALLSAFPLAIFGILPNALIGDLVEEHEQRTGEHMSGMFYGVRAFVMKAGISLANLIFPSLLLFGKSQENPLGVQLSAVFAMLLCLAGWQTFRRFESFSAVDGVPRAQ
jgi:GPH family glycoside/pentoside/hexuronide:cation symporter